MLILYYSSPIIQIVAEINVLKDAVLIIMEKPQFLFTF